MNKLFNLISLIIMLISAGQAYYGFKSLESERYARIFLGLTKIHFFICLISFVLLLLGVGFITFSILFSLGLGNLNKIIINTYIKKYLNLFKEGYLLLVVHSYYIYHWKKKGYQKHDESYNNFEIN